MQTGYFFCGDLLGFSKIVTNLSSIELDNKMQEWVSLVKDIAIKNGIVKIQLISDTIFAAVHDDKNELIKLVNFARDILNECTPKSLLVRGAIVRGDFTFSDSFVYGNAVICAHRLEQQQDWIGVMLDCADISDSEHVEMDLIHYAVPMASAVIKTYPALRWNIPQYDLLAKYSTGGGLTNIGEALDWRWGGKIQNTVIFNLYIKFIRQNGHSPHLFRGNHNIHWIDSMMHNPILVRARMG